MGQEITVLTRRFITCVASLKNQKRIKTDNEVAIAIDYPKTNLSSVLKGKRNIPYKYAFAFAKAYQIPDFFAEQDENITTAKMSTRKSAEPLYIRPYNLPVIESSDQSEYLKLYEEPDYIRRRFRYLIPDEVDQRGAEWRWFETGGTLRSTKVHENELLLCRLMHVDDWNLLEKHTDYIVLTEKKLLLLELIDNSTLQLVFNEMSKKKQVKITKASIRELWKVRQTG